MTKQKSKKIVHKRSPQVVRRRSRRRSPVVRSRRRSRRISPVVRSRRRSSRSRSPVVRSRSPVVRSRRRSSRSRSPVVRRRSRSPVVRSKKIRRLPVRQTLDGVLSEEQKEKRRRDISKGIIKTTIMQEMSDKNLDIGKLLQNPRPDIIEIIREIFSDDTYALVKKMFEDDYQAIEDNRDALVTIFGDEGFKKVYKEINDEIIDSVKILATYIASNTGRAQKSAIKELGELPVLNKMYFLDHIVSDSIKISPVTLNELINNIIDVASEEGQAKIFEMFFGLQQTNSVRYIGIDDVRTKSKFPLLINAIYEYDQWPIGERPRYLKVIDILLENKADPNVVDKPLLGLSALTNAVRFRKLDIVEKLLSSGADINTTDNNDLTPLMYAVQNKNIDTLNKNIDILEKLLSSGARVDLVTNAGSNALTLALVGAGIKGMPVVPREMVELLLKYDVDIYNKGHDDISAYAKVYPTMDKTIIDLVNKKVDLSKITASDKDYIYKTLNEKYDSTDRDLLKFLTLVPYELRYEFLQNFIAKHTKDIKNILGDAKQHYLLTHSLENFVYRVLEDTPGLMEKYIELKIIDASILTEEDSTKHNPMSRAILLKKINTIKELLKNNVDIDAPNKNGFTPLFTAVLHRRDKENGIDMKTIKEIFALADINKKSGPRSISVLQAGIVNSDMDIIEWLFDDKSRLFPLEVTDEDIVVILDTVDTNFKTQVLRKLPPADKARAEEMDKKLHPERVDSTVPPVGDASTEVLTTSGTLEDDEDNIVHMQPHVASGGTQPTVPQIIPQIIPPTVPPRLQISAYSLDRFEFMKGLLAVTCFRRKFDSLSFEYMPSVHGLWPDPVTSRRICYLQKFINKDTSDYIIDSTKSIGFKLMTGLNLDNTGFGKVKQSYFSRLDPDYIINKEWKDHGAFSGLEDINQYWETVFRLSEPVLKLLYQNQVEILKSDDATREKTIRDIVNASPLKDFFNSYDVSPDKIGNEWIEIRFNVCAFIENGQYVWNYMGSELLNFLSRIRR